MNWERTLKHYERANRRIGQIFVLLGIATAVFGLANVYLNFEYLCIQAFGTIYPNTSSALAFAMFSLPYLFTGIGLVLLGVTIERKKNAKMPLLVLILLPAVYSITKFSLAYLVGVYYSSVGMMRNVLLSGFFIAGYMIAGKES